MDTQKPNKLQAQVNESSWDILRAARILFGASTSQVIISALELYDAKHNVREQVGKRFLDKLESR